MENEDFKPTVWRTARALSNEKRLRLLHEVWLANGNRSVSALAERVGLSVSTASDYLRALNARGLISVERDKSYVFYANGSDRSLRDAQTLQEAFSKVFASGDLPEDWAQGMLPLLWTYAHFRRLAIIRCIASDKGIAFCEISARTDIPDASLARHLAMLKDAGVVICNADGEYMIAKPRGSVAAALLKIALA